MSKKPSKSTVTHHIAASLGQILQHQSPDANAEALRLIERISRKLPEIKDAIEEMITALPEPVRQTIEPLCRSLWSLNLEPAISADALRARVRSWNVCTGQFVPRQR